ncbi:MAG: fumarate hydratase C-terminal domain-containing protein [Chloroflexota bacterium]|nr:fumarate hydratase C-terminal domain-containing protein [Chloroflexota bacterium]
MRLRTPLQLSDIRRLQVGDQVELDGMIYAGRDAVLPKIMRLIQEGRIAELGVPLEGMVIFHTAVSDAGIGPTSSNKLEIESSIAPLSAAGVRMHLGKGALSAETIRALAENESVYAVTPPVTALLTSKVLSRRVVAFPAEGIEAFHELLVEGFPAIIAAAHGRSIYDRET